MWCVCVYVWGRERVCVRVRVRTICFHYDCAQPEKGQNSEATIVFVVVFMFSTCFIHYKQSVIASYPIYLSTTIEMCFNLFVNMHGVNNFIAANEMHYSIVVDCWSSSFSAQFEWRQQVATNKNERNGSRPNRKFSKAGNSRFVQKYFFRQPNAFNQHSWYYHWFKCWASISNSDEVSSNKTPNILGIIQYSVFSLQISISNVNALSNILKLVEAQVSSTITFKRKPTKLSG